MAAHGLARGIQKISLLGPIPRNLDLIGLGHGQGSRGFKTSPGGARVQPEVRMVELGEGEGRTWRFSCCLEGGNCGPGTELIPYD